MIELIQNVMIGSGTLLVLAIALWLLGAIIHHAPWVAILGLMAVFGYLVRLVIG